MTPAHLSAAQQRLEHAASLLGELAGLHEYLHQLAEVDEGHVLQARVQLVSGDWVTLSVSAGEIRARLGIERRQRLADALAATRRVASDLALMEEGEAERLSRVV
jgi:hypothetical protein